MVTFSEGIHLQARSGPSWMIFLPDTTDLVGSFLSDQ